MSASIQFAENHTSVIVEARKRTPGNRAFALVVIFAAALAFVVVRLVTHA